MAAPFDEEVDHRIANFFGRDPTKPGRPTAEEREFRETFEKGCQLRIVEQQFPGFIDSFMGRNESQPNERVERDRSGSTEGLLEGFLSGIVSEKTIESFKPLIDLSDETLKKAIVDYGPPAAAIVSFVSAWWMAEEFLEIPTSHFRKETIPAEFEDRPIFEEREVEDPRRRPDDTRPRPTVKVQVGTERIKIKDEETVVKRVKIQFPPVLHSLVGLLLQFLQLVDTLTRFLGGFGDILFVETISQVGERVFSDVDNLIKDPNLETAKAARGTGRKAITGVILEEFLKGILGQKKKKQDEW